MRSIFCLPLLMCLAVAGLGQSVGYAPKKGETVLKIQIEGRGNVFILLHTAEAPKTTAHIVQLVTDGFYTGQRFHRVVRNPKPYLVQIGDPASKTGDITTVGNGGSGKAIPFEETNFANVVGAVGLARVSQDDKNSGDSQFYILLDRSRFLDGNYTVFGQVVFGMDVVKKIQLADKVTSMSILKG